MTLIIKKSNSNLNIEWLEFVSGMVFPFIWFRSKIHLSCMIFCGHIRSLPMITIFHKKSPCPVTDFTKSSYHLQLGSFTVRPQLMPDLERRTLDEPSTKCHCAAWNVCVKNCGVWSKMSLTRVSSSLLTLWHIYFFKKSHSARFSGLLLTKQR